MPVSEIQVARASYFTQKSHNSLMSAKILLDYHLTNDCMNRLYYAALFASRAALLSKGVEVHTHTHTRSMFALYFGQPGLLPRDTCRIFYALIKKRRAADYNDFSVVTRKEATSSYDETVLFIEAIESVLLQEAV